MEEKLFVQGNSSITRPLLRPDSEPGQEPRDSGMNHCGPCSRKALESKKWWNQILN